MTLTALFRSNNNAVAIFFEARDFPNLLSWSRLGVINPSDPVRVLCTYSVKEQDCASQRPLFQKAKIDILK